MKGFVYILRSLKKGRYYIGSTINILNRFSEHEKGEVFSTRNLRPFEMVFSQEFDSILIARRIELKLKKYKSRTIIDQIVKDGRIEKI